RTVKGVGNGNGFEGCYAGHVVGTYLHGPALARNPALADLLLSWRVGPLSPLDDSRYDALRQERLSTVLAD
ncbi:MAG TPA: glutamine amidotransferase, partial [Nonomuraea sp.]|nr:glutamine amidotransferase [Nonomuraea sp.]